ncbi:MAG: endonuclease III domain-containing protein [Candidatus Hinthialibacter sp.]
MKANDIHEVVRILRQEAPKWKTPAVTIVAGDNRNPFYVLVSCILSLRTKDETTGAAFQRLVKRARTPQELLRIPAGELAQIIYPVGFYNRKAVQLLDIARDLIERFGGRTPDGIEDLLTLKGVGRKTANLVVTLGHRKPGICVDTHVHRICNRWGYVQTAAPDKTEFALRQKLPQEYWIEINDLLVTYGQNLCSPVSPKCSQCRIEPYCKKIGVTKHR